MFSMKLENLIAQIVRHEFARVSDIMKLENLVAQIVRHEFARVSDIAMKLPSAAMVVQAKVTDALYLNFDLRLSSYEDGNQYNESRGLHLLYHAFNTTYITVFSGVTPSCFGKITDVTEWKHECTHDSTWRNLQVFSRLYFEMANCINDKREQDGFKPVAPITMSECNGFNLFRDELFRWVPVKITKDPNDSSNYRKLVEIV